MPPKGRGPAHGDSPQGPVLLATQGVPVARQKGGAMLVHHIGDFEWQATHGSGSKGAGNARATRGLAVGVSPGRGRGNASRRVTMPIERGRHGLTRMED